MKIRHTYLERKGKIIEFINIFIVFFFLEFVIIHEI